MANYTKLFTTLFALSLTLGIVCTCMPSVVASHVKSDLNVVNPNEDPRPITTVSMLNSVPGTEAIVIHCKSKDDDLGQQVIPHAQIYHFTFQPNLQRTTLYYCDLTWSGASKSFDIYDYKRDNKRCGGKVEWSANAQGLYCPGTSGGGDVFIPWK